MIPVARVQLSDEEIVSATAVLKSGALRQGAECEAFEAEFAQKMGANHAITCANGTAALHLSCIALLQPGDEVLVPSFTFIATASAVVLAGAKPIFCDISPDTFLIDLEDAAKKITPKTKAIIPVHLFGNMCDIPAVQTFAKANNLRVIWDAAQAHGACWDDTQAGAPGDVVCYSFYPTKNIFVGEGGMICTPSDELARELRLLREHGMERAYYHTRVGLNYRLNDVAAAIGRVQLSQFDRMQVTRRRYAKRLNDTILPIAGLRLPSIEPQVMHAWHQYVVVVEAEFALSRDAFAAALKTKDIGSAVYYPIGLHQQPIFEEIYGKQSALPVTEYLCHHILALPVHHLLTDLEIEQVAEAVQAIASE